MIEDQISVMLINYGLAGIVVYIFYRLVTNELKELRNEIARLSEGLKALRASIERWSR